MIFSKLKDILTSDYQYIKNKFYATFGYFPDLKNPKTFNEKINWRKLYDHRKIFRQFADKLEVRNYIREKIGESYFIKILQIVNSPEQINYSILPQAFVIKATHGSGWIKIIRDKNKIDKIEIKNYFNKILSTDYYTLGREWCYKNLEPRLVVEELLTDSNGDIPMDYKFFCFDGGARIIQVDFDRFKEHKRNLYDAEFKLINCAYTFPNNDTYILPPENLQELKFIASRLSEGLDFVRVDLYSIRNKIYFGEMTNYPENGFGKFEPREYDLIFGDYWTLK